MASNTENTEGKLAAYIDGQLDPAERAEIERYLAANPEHQKLLADMIAQRAVLRSLPRDRAPGDIYDAIQAQLERSILLDDANPASVTAVRHSRRSQLFAAAAILVLAVGLAGVLYFVLPSTQLSPTEVAVVPHASTAATEHATTTDALAESDTDAATSPVGGIAAVADKETAPLASKSSGPALSLAAAPSLKSAVVSNAIPSSPTFELLSAQTREVKDLVSQIPALNGTQQGAQQQLVVLVSTDNPSYANRQVTSYLESNNIRWDTVPVAYNPRTATDVVSRTQFRRALIPDQAGATSVTEDNLARGGGVTESGAGGTTAVQPSADDTSATRVTGETKLAYNEPQRLKQKFYGTLDDSKKTEAADRTEARKDDAPASAAAPPQQQQQEQLQSQVAQQSPEENLGAVSQDLQQGQQVGQQAEVQQPLSDEGAAQPQLQQQSQQQIELQQQAPADPADRRQLIVARGMTRQQAIQLADTLSTNAANQRARLLLEETVSDGQLAGRFEQTPATTAPVHTFFDSAQLRDSRVTSAGEPPTTSHAVGIATESLRKSEADAATTPATPAPSENVSITTGAAPEAAGSATTTTAVPTTTTAPTTAPATQSDEMLDVVILVDADPAIAAPATAPATTAPTSQQAAPPAPNTAPEEAF